MIADIKINHYIEKTVKETAKYPCVGVFTNLQKKTIYVIFFAENIGVKIGGTDIEGDEIGFFSTNWNSGEFIYFPGYSITFTVTNE